MKVSTLNRAKAAVDALEKAGIHVRFVDIKSYPLSEKEKHPEEFVVITIGEK